MPERKLTLAVIGTGIAGLSAAWLLRNQYRVTVFESQSRAGMGVHTIDWTSRGKQSRIDVPLRIFSRGYYKHLLALYEHVGVKILATDHAGAFADGDGDMLFHYGNFNIGGQSISYPRGRSLFDPHAWKIGLQGRRFFARATKDMKNPGTLSDTSFGQYLQDSKAGPEFVDTVLLPMMSVTCTCDYQAVRDYPADIMLGYLTSGVQELGIMSAAKGVDDIVPRLLDGVELLTDSPVAEIRSGDDALTVTVAGGDSRTFDHVVVAAQAQQASAMLSGFDAQKQLLDTVPFETSEMSVHTDESLLPGRADQLSPVSYHIPEGSTRSEVTVNLTRTIARLNDQDTVFQTWNPIRDPDPDKELARVSFTRPTVTQDSRDAMSQLRDFHGQQGNRLWFCGSYVADKIPLLDAAVDSSVAVAERLGVPIPWQSGAAD
ncbi:Predicted NAD/FAD-binding protein [Parasphingorhabdus marina DSM 22363]|uniref:Predicted NAD/FAD-binding protein n=1 Tax=Parasphingorhabdus marina DSM 22363 TaxID=1123272 RepID=A0A1N6CMD0_9SPHN|nr:FAD-dependent oxidoreductase [Parasphingorhabdus marina]SIN59544.1 Predicted NAD/FAD-binding protein [Parasphingorhabdus marina DSM 22363]